MHRYTEDQAREKLQQIATLRAEGYSRVDACKKAKFSMGSYIKWSKKFENNTEVVIHESSAVATPMKRAYKRASVSTMNGKCIVMVTDVGSVAQLLKEFM